MQITEMVCGGGIGKIGTVVCRGMPGGIIESLVGAVPCHYITKNVCKNVKECQDVVKCDTVYQ